MNIHNRKEIWKSPLSVGIPWFEVSNLGNVRSLTHEEVFVRNGIESARVRYGHRINGSYDSRGRKMVMNPSNKKLCLVHRLVAECFVDKKKQFFDMVFFRSGNCSDCRAVNLKWGNVRDKSMRTNYRKSTVGLFFPDKDNEIPIKVFESMAAAAQYLGITKQAVCSAVQFNSPCCGYKIKEVTPKCGIKIEKKNWDEKECCELDGRVYSKKSINIKRKAIFK